MHLKIVFLDDHVRPDDVEQIVLVDDSLAPLDQRHKHVERARAELGGLAVDQQLSLGAAQFEAAESNRCRSVRRVRGHALSQWLWASLAEVGRPIKND